MSGADWLVVLWLGAAFVYLSIIAHKEEPACNGCSRKGCRREAGWQGCNHKPRTDGSASGSTKED